MRRETKWAPAHPRPTSGPTPSILSAHENPPEPSLTSEMLISVSCHTVQNNSPFSSLSLSPSPLHVFTSFFLVLVLSLSLIPAPCLHLSASSHVFSFSLIVFFLLTYSLCLRLRSHRLRGSKDQGPQCCVVQALHRVCFFFALGCYCFWGEEEDVFADVVGFSFCGTVFGYGRGRETGVFVFDVFVFCFPSLYFFLDSCVLVVTVHPNKIKGPPNKQRVQHLRVH